VNSAGKNAWIVVLVFACAGLAVCAWWQHTRLQALEARLASAMREQSDAGERLAAAEARARELESLAATRREPESVATAQAAPVQQPPVTRRESARGQAGFATMMNNPDFQKAMVAGIRSSLDARYATLFKRLRLPPAELEKLKNLLVDRQAAGMDVLAASASEGMAAAGGVEGMRALMEKAQADVDEGIRAVLGDERFAQYKDFDRNAPSYAVADQLERRLSYTATPLQPAQADELVRILAENAPAPAAGADGRAVAAYGGGVGNMVFAPFVSGSANVLATGGASMITDQALAQAEGILAPDQFASLKELQSEQQAMAKLLQGARTGFRVTAPAMPAPVQPGGG
jgi:hypothetical protein